MGHWVNCFRLEGEEEMTHNVENWTYKSKAEIEALPDDKLIKVRDGLFEAIALFHKHNTKLTDEMVWQFFVVPEVCRERGLVNNKI